MRCPECEQAGARHSVYEGISSRTAMMGSPAYWDENGHYHSAHDPNSTTTSYRCSNGHTWPVTYSPLPPLRGTP